MFLTGNGRRICPGIHLADRGLYHAIVKMLWAFDIKMANDPETGEPIVPNTDMLTGYREGLTACAHDFPVHYALLATHFSPRPTPYALLAIIDYYLLLNFPS